MNKWVPAKKGSNTNNNNVGKATRKQTANSKKSIDAVQKKQQ